MTLVSVLMTLLWMTESPLWQYKMGKVEEATVTMKKMMKMNGVDCDTEIDELGMSITQDISGNIAQSSELRITESEQVMR